MFSQVMRLHAKKLKVTFIEKAVLDALADRLDEDPACYVKQQTIADQVGCSRQSVSRAIKRLTQLDYIGKTPRVLNGVKRGNYYAVNFEKLIGLPHSQFTKDDNIVQLRRNG